MLISAPRVPRLSGFTYSCHQMILFKHRRKCECIGQMRREVTEDQPSLEQDVREIEFTYANKKAFTRSFTRPSSSFPSPHPLTPSPPSFQRARVSTWGTWPAHSLLPKCCMPAWTTNHAPTPVCIYLMYIDIFKIK